MFFFFISCSDPMLLFIVFHLVIHNPSSGSIYEYLRSKTWMPRIWTCIGRIKIETHTAKSTENLKKKNDRMKSSTPIHCHNLFLLRLCYLRLMFSVLPYCSVFFFFSIWTLLFMHPSRIVFFFSFCIAEKKNKRNDFLFVSFCVVLFS